MKIRAFFVANSSTTSFCGIGFQVEEYFMRFSELTNEPYWFDNVYSIEQQLKADGAKLVWHYGDEIDQPVFIMVPITIGADEIAIEDFDLEGKIERISQMRDRIAPGAKICIRSGIMAL